MSKRRATVELNHLNWDQEEKSEEPSQVFQQASSEVLKTRVIKTAKRHIKTTDSKPSPFSHFAGFGATSSTSNINSPFSFLNQNKDKPLVDGEKNGTNNDNNSSSATKDNQTQFKSFTNTFLNSDQPKDSLNFFSNLTQKNTSTETTFKPFEHIFKSSKSLGEKDNEDKKSKNLELLKDLNLSCCSWISEHLQKNPYCILTPIFKDYEKHLAEIDLKVSSGGNNEDIETVSEKSGPTKTSSSESTKSDSTVESADSDSQEKSKEGEKSAEFKFENPQPKLTFNFQYNSENKTFGGITTPFSLNQIAAKPVVAAETESKNDEDSEEPPKNDFVLVREEDSIFDIKCKVFVKREGNFIPKGVGTLFLKPVKDSKKTQLIVRAHTNLGNILLNILLTSGMPIKKTGKNNAMIVCIPTPDSKPPPVPVLIRVKTSEECDTLIKKLEECRDC